MDSLFEQHTDEEKSVAEQQSSQLMNQYFRLINTHMHGVPGGKIESESFRTDFRMPKSYDIPKFKKLSEETNQLISTSRCKQFPDKVLFFIFYNMPHDKAQVSASEELKARQWSYLEKSMLWVKPNTTGKKDVKKKPVKGKSSPDETTRTVIVFNP